ncbi:MAG: YceD family protein [Candidatus Competibacterales bacterium]
MSQLPATVDPWALAAEGQDLEGVLPQTAFDRLKEVVIAPVGEVALEARGGVDDRGVHYLRGRLVTTVQVICQRCMNPMELAVDTDLCVGLVRSEGEAARLPAIYEPLQPEAEGLDVYRWVEDELLLALPLAPRHQSQTCQPLLEESAKAKAPSPFAALAALRKGRD